MPRFTKIESRIITTLKDGRSHTPEELLECLEDPMADMVAMRMHLSRIRKKLRPAGQEILCHYDHKRILYIWVRLIGKG